MEQIKFVILEQEELRAIRSPILQSILDAVSVPNMRTTLTVQVSIMDGGPGQTHPHLEVSADLERNGAAYWTAPNPPMLMFIDKAGLKDLCRGSCFVRDEHGLVPKYLLEESPRELWDPVNEEILCLLMGITPELALALRSVEPAKRVSAARELIPEWQSIWKSQFDKAVLAAELI